MGYLKTSISKEDLKTRCEEAIEKRWSIHKLFMTLKSEGHSVGYPRLRDMWLKCRGFITDNNRFDRRYF